MKEQPRTCGHCRHWLPGCFNPGDGVGMGWCQMWGNNKEPWCPRYPVDGLHSWGKAGLETDANATCGGYELIPVRYRPPKPKDA